MIISRVRLKNWRNFQGVDVRLGQRAFIVGPNASGKSNFLDVFRFLKDIAKPGGGLQTAIGDRGGLSKIRCLAARQYPNVEIEIEISNGVSADAPRWKYLIAIRQELRGARKPFLSREAVWENGEQILERPDGEDKKDEARLTQTHLEQINANKLFRDIAQLLESVQYMHLVPQLVRHSKAFTGPGLPGDPFGRQILERIARTPEKTRRARLRRIEGALKKAVPQLSDLAYVIDKNEGGIPHLEVVYAHWRPRGAKQREVDFSDGTLRLIGLLWSLQEGDAPLLLEEPELSLHYGIVRKLPALMHRAARKARRQLITSTHSAELLSDQGIGAEEMLMLTPGREGTSIQIASDRAEIRSLLESGLSIGEAVLPRTEPAGFSQLEFEDWLN